MADSVPIHELPAEIRGMAYAYCNGDQDRAMAILMKSFENQPYRQIEAKTGIPRSTVQELVTGFRDICDRWKDRRSAQVCAKINNRTTIGAC